MSIRVNPCQKILFWLFFFVFLAAGMTALSEEDSPAQKSRIDSIISGLTLSQEIQWVNMAKNSDFSKKVSVLEKTFSLGEPHGTMFYRRSVRTRLSGGTIRTTVNGTTNGYRVRIPARYGNLKNLLLGYGDTSVRTDDFMDGITPVGIAPENIYHYSLAAQVSTRACRTLEIGYSEHRTRLNNILIRPTLKTNIVSVSLYPEKPDRIDWQVSAEHISPESLSTNYKLTGLAKYHPTKNLTLSLTLGLYTHGVPPADSTYSEAGSQLAFSYLNDSDLHDKLDRFYSEKLGFYIFSAGYEVKF